MKRINLLPPEMAQRRLVKRRALSLVVAGALVVALLGTVTFWRFVELGNQTERRDEAQAQVETLEDERDSLREFAELEALVSRKERTLALVMANDVEWSRILTELSMIIPEEAWLTSFGGAAAVPEVQEGQAPVGPSIGTVNFSAVTFEFPDVAKWIIRLQGMKSLQNVWVPSASKDALGSRQVVNFTSTAELSPGSASGRYRQGTP